MQIPTRFGRLFDFVGSFRILFEKRELNFSRKSLRASFRDRDKLPKPDGTATMLRVKSRDEGVEKKIRSAKRRSKERRENVSIWGTKLDFFQVHLSKSIFILGGYSPSRISHPRLTFTRENLKLLWLSNARRASLVSSIDFGKSHEFSLDF